MRMSPIVPASLAETRARSKLGMAIAAMIPMIATTIRSSIRVKPFCFFICSTFPFARYLALATPWACKPRAEAIRTLNDSFHCTSVAEENAFP